MHDMCINFQQDFCVSCYVSFLLSLIMIDIQPINLYSTKQNGSFSILFLACIMISCGQNGIKTDNCYDDHDDRPIIHAHTSTKVLSPLIYVLK